MRRNRLCGPWLLLMVLPMLALASGPPNAPQLDFAVQPRAGELDFFPCSDCHEHMEPNPERRQLVEASHLADVRHGSADLWCTNCHALQKRQQLRTQTGWLVDFDDSHLVCRDCHATAYRDWRYGAHGKRVGPWRGQREVLNCTACHDPHFNLLPAPRRPLPPPGVRAGLERPQHAAPVRLHSWRRGAESTHEGQDGQGQEDH